MNLKNFGAFFRKIGVVMLVLMLVLFFLSLYYFKYVPDNRESLQHQGFLVLRQDEKGILQNDSDLIHYFQNQAQLIYKKTFKSFNKADTQYKKPFSYTLSIKRNKKKLAWEKNHDVTFLATHIDPDHINSIEYLFVYKTDSLIFAVPFATFFERILGGNKYDIFSAYLVLCQHHAEKNSQEYTDLPDEKTDTDKTGAHDHPHIFYHSPGLSVAEQIGSDSLGKALSPIQFSKIIDLETDGNKYKAFLLPFALRGNTFVLAGLMRGKDYNERLEAMPFSIVSGLVIILLFILICFPYLKIFLISAEERFSVNDIIFLGGTLFLGTALFLVMIQHTFMHTGAERRIKDELRGLGDTISHEFHDEILKACNELTFLDTTLKLQVDANAYIKSNNINLHQNQLFVTSDSLYDKNKGYCLDINDNYLNYTAIQWVDGSGQQIYWARLDSGPIFFSNISYRQYFQNVNNGHLYSCKNGAQIQPFTFEPVYNTITSEFATNIAIPSHLGKAKLIGLLANLYSLMNPVLPEGYGFYLVNDAGLIFFQSEGQVTLKENLFEWMMKDRDVLQQTISNREGHFFSNVYIFDKQYSIFVQPLNNLPFYLVTFHKNEYTIVSHLRIVAFVLFSLMVLYVVIGIISFVAWRKADYFTRLNQSVFQYSWLRPAKENKRYLQNSILYLVLATLFTVIFVAFHHDSSSLFIGFIYPIVASATLSLLFWHSAGIRKSLENEKSKLSNAALFIISSIFLLLFLGVYWHIEQDVAARNSLFFYAVLVLIISAVFYYYGKKKLAASLVFKKKAPLVRRLADLLDKNTYYIFWFCCVFALALLPVHLFFAYAHKRETCLVARGQQLYLAEQFAGRLQRTDWFNNINYTRKVTQKQSDSIYFIQGFYGLNRYFQKSTPNTDSKADRPFIYDSIIGNISWSYRYINNKLPVQIHSTDSSWKWGYSRNGSAQETYLAYNIPLEMTRPGISKGLVIETKIPGFWNYNGINDGVIICLIIVFSVLLLVAFFSLLQYVAKRAFLVQYFNRDTEKDNYILKQFDTCSFQIDENIGELKGKYPALANEQNMYEALKKIWDNEYRHEDSLGYITNISVKNEMRIYKMENIILMNQQYLAEFYKQLWEACDEKEKYFLYDMAEDGFVNYKNAQMVQQLMGKGLIYQKEPGNLRMMSISFRNYILSKKGDKDIVQLKEKNRVTGSWNNFQIPVQIAIAVISIFLFITQQDIVTKLLALIPNVNALIGLSSTIIRPRANIGSAK